MTEETRPTDQEILAYEKTIAAEFLAAPLVGEASSFDALISEYENNPKIHAKTLQLAAKAQAMRCIRKDGNCFYRALSYALCEALLNYKTLPWATAVRNRVLATRTTLVDTGYDPMITEDFFEPLNEALEPDFSAAKLDEFFSKEKEYLSDTIVCYLRLATAAELKKNRDMYEAFILDSYPTIEAFIANQVEPMGVESDQIHIVAMANALGVTINIADLDSSDSDLNFHDISPMFPLEIDSSVSHPVLNFLYRPGHYDIVYIV
ncbi:OTU domain, ubiquitin aldehyde binding [Physocladia obscura]|uniref:ubiquitinyl hydrolase 1 n=1 Tax=Physocladia obscura TaxID=109957 RepID=A0AAD5XH63_9FUNG|nr:OTU domain, ubiquitin aldehyde binding [Physocladia obscura]